jgi:hypothetical protein
LASGGCQRSATDLEANHVSDHVVGAAFGGGQASVEGEELGKGREVMSRLSSRLLQGVVTGRWRESGSG